MNNAEQKVEFEIDNPINIFEEERFSNEVEQIDRYNIDEVCSNDFIEYWEPYLNKVPYEWSFHPHPFIQNDWELCSPFHKGIGVPVERYLNNPKGNHLVNVALKRYELFYKVFNNKKSNYNAILGALCFVDKVWKVDYLHKFLFKSSNEVLSIKQKWDLIRETWCVIEFPYKHEIARICWNDIFNRTNRPMCIVNQFPVDKEYTVYRGGHPEGLSWTTSKECATWFYKRWDINGRRPDYKLSKKTVKGNDIIFSGNRGNEDELVLHPRTLKMEYTEVEPSSPELVDKWRNDGERWVQ